MKILLPFFLVLTVWLAGCSTTTEKSQQSAAATKQIVERFRVLEQKQLNDLNTSYNQEFGKIVTEMTTLTWKETDQQFDREATQIADQLSRDWAIQTQPSTISSLFQTTVDGDFLSLSNAQAGLNNLQTAYGTQYKTASAQLNLLQQIESNLDPLSHDTSEWNQTQQTLKMIYEAYQNTQSGNTASTVSTNAVTNKKP